MNPNPKWVLKLAKPMVFGTQFQGIDRDEVIDTIVVSPHAAGAALDPPADIEAAWKAIDWHRSEAMSREEFAGCAVARAVVAATAAAFHRAELFCAWKAEMDALGIDSTHSSVMRDWRLSLAKEGRAEH